jgi:hypothetical protein
MWSIGVLPPQDSRGGYVLEDGIYRHITSPQTATVVLSTASLPTLADHDASKATDQAQALCGLPR